MRPDIALGAVKERERGLDKRENSSGGNKEAFVEERDRTLPLRPPNRAKRSEEKGAAQGIKGREDRERRPRLFSRNNYVAKRDGRRTQRRRIKEGEWRTGFAKGLGHYWPGMTLFIG
ncbi:hypothetical protein KM043_016348 [Ampulex compressa]|nr:hypothetical protein KM043_016348 [Ampulex compressa]